MFAPLTDPRDFTIVVMPDTQMYARSYPEIFHAQADWITAHSDELGVRMVWHLGDVIHEGAEKEEPWQHAAAAMKKIDDRGLPCLIAIGNHDYDDQLKASRSANHFNRYFGIERYRGRPWFGGAFDPERSENVYATLEIGGRKYLFLLLEFGPRKAVVDWANGVVREHPDHDVFVVTHCYMHYHNGRTGQGDEWNPHNYVGSSEDCHDGEELWQALVSRHPNICWVHNGHILKHGQGRRTDLGVHGNAVHQIASNYQTHPNGGDGWLRILRVKISIGMVESITYSPTLDEFLTGEEHAYVLTYPPLDRPATA